MTAKRTFLVGILPFFWIQKGVPLETYSWNASQVRQLEEETVEILEY